jgi:hypothetical protein
MLKLISEMEIARGRKAGNRSDESGEYKTMTLKVSEFINHLGAGCFLI